MCSYFGASRDPARRCWGPIRALLPLERRTANGGVQLNNPGSLKLGGPAHSCERPATSQLTTDFFVVLKKMTFGGRA